MSEKEPLIEADHCPSILKVISDAISQDLTFPAYTVECTTVGHLEKETYTYYGLFPGDEEAAAMARVVVFDSWFRDIMSECEEFAGSTPRDRSQVWAISGIDDEVTKIAVRVSIRKIKDMESLLSILSHLFPIDRLAESKTVEVLR